MSKCEIVGDRLVPCLELLRFIVILPKGRDRALRVATLGLNADDTHNRSIVVMRDGDSSTMVWFCPFCGADLSQPFATVGEATQAKDGEDENRSIPLQ